MAEPTVGPVLQHNFVQCTKHITSYFMHLPTWQHFNLQNDYLLVALSCSMLPQLLQYHSEILCAILYW